MDVAKSFLEPQHFFADDRKAEVAGLDDAGVHRAYGDFVYTVTFDADKVIAIGFGFPDERRSLLARERMKVRGPGGVTYPRPGILRAAGNAREIPNCPLHTRGRGKNRVERRIRRVFDTQGDY